MNYYNRVIFSLVLAFINALQLINGASILVFLPSTSRSHFKPFERVFVELAKRGHNMTIMSKFPPKVEIANYSHFQIEANYDFAGKRSEDHTTPHTQTNDHLKILPPPAPPPPR